MELKCLTTREVVRLCRVNTPLYCLTEKVLRREREIICISSTLSIDVERLARDYKIFTEQIGNLKIPIVLGGRTFKDAQIRRRFPAALYARSFTKVVKLAQKLTGK